MNITKYYYRKYNDKIKKKDKDRVRIIIDIPIYKHWKLMDIIEKEYMKDIETIDNLTNNYEIL